jgi:hypothetical protein
VLTNRLRHLGIDVDPAEPVPGNISRPGAAVRTVVVTADEERVMDRSARELLTPVLDGART